MQWLSVGVRGITALPAMGSLEELRYLQLVGLPELGYPVEIVLRQKLTRLKGFELCSNCLGDLTCKGGFGQFWAAVQHV